MRLFKTATTLNLLGKYVTTMLPKQKIGNDKKAIQCLVLSCFICVAVFLLTIPLPRSDGHLTGSDGLSYYAIHNL